MSPYYTDTASDAARYFRDLESAAEFEASREVALDPPGLDLEPLPPLRSDWPIDPPF